MKFCLTIFLLLLFAFGASGQVRIEADTGAVSYISSTNVYVKFSSTEKMEKGDTLYTIRSGSFIPGLIIENKSSMSCVCRPITRTSFERGDAIYFIPVTKQMKKVEEPEKEIAPIPPATAGLQEEPEVEKIPEIEGEDNIESGYSQQIRGRISAASYSNLSSHGDLHRMRYTFSLRGDHLGNSRFSTDNYISFRHTANEWEEVKNNLNRALKIYALSVSYDLNNATNVTLGRKTNHKISSIGAIDGLQFEQGFGRFLVGAIAGSRPDMQDYSINLDLLQAGVYIGHESGEGEKYQQSTLGLVEQRNSGEVDRRFLYFQHSDALMDKLRVFASFEFDLFENINDNPQTAFNLTNLYVNLRYRFSRKISAYAAYDARNNIIYYESYKSYIEQLIDEETRQGLRVGMTVRPIRYVSLGANASWRFQKSNDNRSRNLNGHLNISRIPVIDASASVSANFLETNYITSKIYRFRLSREVIENRVNADVYFKLVNYRYQYSEDPFRQKVAGANLNIRLTRKLGLYLYYEATLDEGDNDLNRINTKLIHRF